MYKINEFSKMVGLPTSRIRFYERHGLLRVKRDNNKYRYFNNEDAFEINTFRTLRNLGFSISDAVEGMNGVMMDDFRTSLCSNHANLINEMTFLQSKINFIKESIETLDEIKENPLIIKRVNMEDHFFLPASIELDFSLSKLTCNDINEWAHHHPITKYAMLMNVDDFMNETKFPESYGFAVSEHQARQLSLPMCEYVKCIRLGDCIGFYSFSHNENAYGISELDHVRSYLEHNNLHISGTLIMFPFMVGIQEDAEISDIEYIIAPVEINK